MDRDDLLPIHLTSTLATTFYGGYLKDYYYTNNPHTVKELENMITDVAQSINVKTLSQFVFKWSYKSKVNNVFV
jgi:hypothetical protein